MGGVVSRLMALTIWSHFLYISAVFGIMSPLTEHIGSATTSSLSEAPRSTPNHADLMRRAKCPVPCGYYQQLCCAANEICYTAPNLQAECSPTALPSQRVTKTVTANARYINTSVVLNLTVTLTTLTSGSTVRTSRITITSMETSTKTFKAPSPTSSSRSPSALNEHQDGWWTPKKEAGIGVVIAVVVLGFLVLIAWLVWRRRKNTLGTRKVGELDEHSEGTEAFQLNDSAHIGQESNRNLFNKQSVRSLQPRERPALRGLNPYEHPSSYSATPWGPDNVAPPYPGSRSNTPGPYYDHEQRRNFRATDTTSGPDTYAGPGGTNSQLHDNLPPPFPGQNRIPRRPVHGTQPTVQEYDEDPY